MKTRCNARLSGERGYCQRYPVRGRARCRFHGGLSTGACVLRARGVTAAVEGRRRWLDRMRRAKAIGLIGKIPGGRIPGRRTGEPIEISRARTMIRDEIKGLPALADRPLAELEPAELLDALTPKALCKL